MGYSYDSNGNLLEDERRGLSFGYNGLGLLETVRGTGGSLQSRYRWLADGTKLGVRDGSGEDGYDYAGSFVYRVSGGERELEGVLWEGGVIRLDSTGAQAARYFIRDHLGSVRVVVENGVVVERNDYYPFGARHEREDYVESDNRYKFNGKEEQLTGGLGWLDYGARMYDAELGRWWSVDPLGEEYAHLSPYNYCSNIPNLLVDPTGSYLTHYVDENYNVLLQTDDGSDDVVMVPDFRMDFFMSVLNASRWDEWRLNSLGWNQYWKDEFGLAARQLTDSELTLADMFHSTWARNNAIAYFLKPNIGNALKLGISESLSQWTDPELVVAGLSAGIMGLQMGLNNLAESPSVNPYTKSNLQLGQQMHRLYKLDEAKTGIGVKEYNKIKGIRPDFVDFNTQTIYELKPNNPRAIKQGWKQLRLYQQEFQKRYPGDWKIVLDVY